MRSPNFTVASALAAGLCLALAACDAARPMAEAGRIENDCTRCHGDGARPESDALLQAAPGTGAHLAHLRDGAFRAGVSCAECHAVPESTGHTDGRVQLPFPSLARADGVTPSWDRAAGTCAVYCHGVTLGGGPAASPAWGADPSLGCTSCHGHPPPSHAPTSTRCGACHEGTVDANGELILSNGQHVNGRLDVFEAHPEGWRNPTQHGFAAKRDLARCRACHGEDYGGGNVGISCNACHGGTAWQTNCTFCHGEPGRAANAAAPPVGTQGETASTARAVGAHQKHLSGGPFGPALACTECHAVPTGLDHVNGTPAVTFGPAARRGLAQPSWDRNSCSGVYCHGATLGAGGTNTAPAWTGSGQVFCGSCHAAPPPPPHTTSTACGTCHDGYAQGTVNAALHMNGTLDVAGHGPGWANPTQHGFAAKRDLARCRTCHGEDYGGGDVGVSCNACHGGTAWQTNCTFCHGEPGRGANAAAPPVGTQGETAPTARAVGAHQKHLSGGPFGPALACTECHAVPTGLEHVNGTPAVAFGPAARRGGAQPSWDRSSCSGVYCHGATLGAGGTNTAPAWTGSGQVFCGSCHAAPPPPPHTTSTACGTCHDGYAQGTVNAALHMNGTLDVAGHGPGWADPAQHGRTVNRSGLASCKTCHGADLTGGGGAPSCNSCHGGDAWRSTCTFCHGTPGGRASPPVDTQGRSIATNVSVGVHASHTGTAITAPLACAQCHPDRTGSNVVTDAGHVDGDGRAEVSLGVLARTGGAPATYTRTSDTQASCSSTYCHGRFPGGANGGQGATMSWTSTQQVSCSSCHGNAPGSGAHDKHDEVSCSECHGHSGSGATHVNGVKNVPIPGIGGAAYTPATGSCGTFSCHGEGHSPSDNNWRD